MQNFMRSLPIYRRLLIAFTIATVIAGIIFILLGNFYSSSLAAHDQIVTASLNAQTLASQQNTNLQHMHSSLVTLVAQVFAPLSGNPQTSPQNADTLTLNDDIKKRAADFVQGLAQYRANYNLSSSDNMAAINAILQRDPQDSKIISAQQAALNAVSDHWTTYNAQQDDVLRQLQTLQNDYLQGVRLSPTEVNRAYTRVYSTLKHADQQFVPLSDNWQLVEDTSVSMGKAVMAFGPVERRPVGISTGIAFLLIVLILLLAGYIMNLTISRPLRVLALLTKRIAGGDTSARATISGHDEISTVSASINKMLDNIVSLIQDAQSRHRELQAQVAKLVSEVSGVAEGDLRVQAEVTGDDLGVLADSFNYMVEELSDLVIRVKLLAREVSISTTETSGRMAGLVESADVQIRQISDATVEVERMADSSRQVAERAQVLYNVAYEARQTAYSGRSSVWKTVEGIERIQENVRTTSEKVQLLGERSREISSIVSVISGIAHQTNRLALDAAIQSAMAGENGQGFGAVAADIRRLAERSKEQATMITRLVRSVLEDITAVALATNDTEQETSSGARLAQDAGTALQSLFLVVERQATEVEMINNVAVQQLRSSQAVAKIMQSVSTSTQRNTNSIRTASEQMQHMANLAEQLHASVDAFKLRDDRGYFILASRPNLIEAPDEQLAFDSDLAFPPAQDTQLAFASDFAPQPSLSDQLVFDSGFAPLPSLSDQATIEVDETLIQAHFVDPFYQQGSMQPPLPTPYVDDEDIFVLPKPMDFPLQDGVEQNW